MIREGYQQTAIGLIPCDWEVKTVGDSFQISNNLRYPISEVNRKKKSGIYPYYGPTKIQDYINEYRVEGEYSLIGEDGDHFLKWNESPMTLLVRGKFNVNNHAHLVKGNEYLTSWFYYYFYHKDITSFLTRQGAGRYKLTKNALSQIPIALPPLPEQKAIAEVLGDVDRLINACDKLIAKKRDIKQGAMQELLTGRSRLPGFSGEWEVKKLGDVCWVNQGLQIPIEQRFKNPVPNSKVYITIQYLNNSKDVEFIKDYSASVCCTEEDILMTRTGNTGIVVSGVNGVFHNNFFKINFDKSSIERQFLIEYLSSNNLQRVILAKAGISTIPDLNHDDFYSIPIVIPSLEEQKAIAQILSDMDSEIEALEKKRDKYKLVKQGMMQELLTGKTRLL